MSATKALRQVGTKAFATVEDLAEAAGLGSIKQLGGAFVDRLVPVLQRLGARVSTLGSLKDVEAVKAAVRADGVVLFSVKWLRGGSEVGHTLYAFRDSIGRILIADRSGAVVTSLAELEKFYGGIGGASVYGPAALVQGPRILLTHGAAVLGMEIRAQLSVNPETAAQTLEIKKEVLANIPPRAAAGYHVVVSGDWLSKLAQKYYGDQYKWPVIYEANRKLIGSNPDLIKPGQRLLIPDLPRVNAVRQK